jgi:hypothetical protein
MAKLSNYIQTEYDNQHIVDFTNNVQIYINGKLLENVVDCQLIKESFGKARIDIIQDKLIYALRK